MRMVPSKLNFGGHSPLERERERRGSDKGGVNKIPKQIQLSRLTKAPKLRVNYNRLMHLVVFSSTVLLSRTAPIAIA